MKHIFSNALTLCICTLFLLGCTHRSSSTYSWEKDLDYRLRYDFSWTEADVKKYIQQYIPQVTDEQIMAWAESGLLESMVIDGERKYFKRTASNLFRQDSACKAIKEAAAYKDNDSMRGTAIGNDVQEEYRQILSLVANPPLAEGKRMKVKYSITVKADAVPAGEKIRCWLPYPRQDVARQQDVVFVGANSDDYIFSHPDCAHSTLYMEKEAVADEPTVFEEEFIYTIYGEYRPISAADVLPYDTTTELYRTYTAERDEHVIFTPQMRALSDSLTRGLTNPYDKVKAIFTWIASTFPWCGAREYSTIANIPEYVLQVKHADCGQKTLLLLTLCRIAGIPCHFQSGLITPPSGWNLHDWAEVYYEGIGWVPIDVSNGFMSLIKGTEHEYFYLTGVDSYRLIVNQDFGMPLSPAKEYPRSETVDFQRGEVEWRGGNLYFDTWSYDMEIEYL